MRRIPSARRHNPATIASRGEPNCQADRVVVTGTNIAGAAEDAALPVEVYTADDSFKQGGQTALEFTKSLSVVGSTLGETNQFQAGYGNIGAATLNLRGLGGGRTLTIFNGRRFTSNINMIPSIALARTEILKDGGAVIYGADATGGVVNFITRDSFDGVMLDGSYKFIDGSDGDYNAAALWGKDFDNGNIMVAYEYGSRSELDITERDWTIQPFSRNPTPWAPYHTLGTYLLNSPTGSTVGVVQDFTADQCRDLVRSRCKANRSALSGLPVCWWNYAIHTYNLVEEQKQHRAYLQVTNDLSDSMRFTGQLAYGKSDTPRIGTVASYQTNVGPALTSGNGVPVPIFRVQTRTSTRSLLRTRRRLIRRSAADRFGGSVPHHRSSAPAARHTCRPAKARCRSTQLENWNAVGALDGDFGDFGGDLAGYLETVGRIQLFDHHDHVA